MNSYTAFAKCRLHKKGDGVLIYAYNNTDALQHSTTEVEAPHSLYIQATVRKKKYTLGVIYRPPRSSVGTDDKLYVEFKNLIRHRKAAICGDFNNPSIRLSA